MRNVQLRERAICQNGVGRVVPEKLTCFRFSCTILRFSTSATRSKSGVPDLAHIRRYFCSFLLALGVAGVAADDEGVTGSEGEVSREVGGVYGGGQKRAGITVRETYGVWRSSRERASGTRRRWCRKRTRRPMLQFAREDSTDRVGDTRGVIERAEEDIGVAVVLHRVVAVSTGEVSSLVCRAGGWWYRRSTGGCG